MVEGGGGAVARGRFLADGEGAEADAAHKDVGGVAHSK